jgi:hypothetical protein
MTTEQLFEAGSDFSRARSKARKSKLLSGLRRKSDNLLSFEDVRKVMSPTGESYIGCKTVQVQQIVGSEGRVEDYNNAFCPRRDFMRHRWCNVDAAYRCGIDLPPVKLLELGGVFFVRDGNHRVSVAKAHRVSYIDAEVIRLDTNIRLHPNMVVGDVEQIVREHDGESAA